MFSYAYICFTSLFGIRTYRIDIFCWYFGLIKGRGVRFLSDENCVLICSFQKDYELQSWNEQGEMTKIEGMLTIAFSFIFSCSHRDEKELYLMIKIHYLVNMSSLDKKRLKKEFGLNRKQSDVLEKVLDAKPMEYLKEKKRRIGWENAFHNLDNKVGELRLQISKLEQEIKELKKENICLKELLGKGSSGWEIKGDNVAVGLDPFDKTIKQYGFPKNFDEKKANDLHFTDDNFYMCSFKYYFMDSHPWPQGPSKEYDMPITLYDYLCSKSKIDVKTTKEVRQTSKKGMPNKFKSPESLLQYFRGTLGKGYYSYTLINIIVPFIFENNKKPFGRKDASEYCKMKRGKKPVDATIHKHFNLLIEHDIIHRKYHGIYEVNKHLINFD